MRSSSDYETIRKTGFGITHLFLVMTSSSDECPGVCRDGEIVLSGWNQCGTLSCGLQWEVEGSVTLYPGHVEKEKLIFFLPHGLGTKLYY